MKYCLKCNTSMEVRQSGETYFWICSDFPACRHMEIIPEHEKATIDLFKKSLVNKKDNCNSQEYTEPLQLGEEQLYVYNLLENTNENLFITGRAGTGKSVLLRHFVHNKRVNAVII